MLKLIFQVCDDILHSNNKHEDIKKVGKRIAKYQNCGFWVGLNV